MMPTVLSWRRARVAAADVIDAGTRLRSATAWRMAAGRPLGERVMMGGIWTCAIDGEKSDAAVCVAEAECPAQDGVVFLLPDRLGILGLRVRMRQERLASLALAVGRIRIRASPCALERDRAPGRMVKMAIDTADNVGTDGVYSEPAEEFYLRLEMNW
jgi:hypothetical protein